MAFSFKYMPILRSRQQELLVLKTFVFGSGMFPLLEIIKEKDRVNNIKSAKDIWGEYFLCQNFEKIFVDLPTYIRDTSSMQDEVLSFNRTTLSNLERRITFFKMFSDSDKIIPVVSTLFYKTGEANSIINQVTRLRESFSSIAIRTFTNTLDNDISEIKQALTGEDILIYDLDTAQPLNPLVKKQMRLITELQVPYQVAVRSAVNTEIQNIKLDHGEVVADADNSLLELFNTNMGMNAFGDYAGIKKDDLNSGGTISPGFIFYDPVDNLFYGFKGEIKSLSEFEDTIVPTVLGSDIVKRLREEHPEYLSDENPGYSTLIRISKGEESGKSQAKFKRIAMEHYLHCIREKIKSGEIK